MLGAQSGEHASLHLDRYLSSTSFSGGSSRVQLGSKFTPTHLSDCLIPGSQTPAPLAFPKAFAFLRFNNLPELLTVATCCQSHFFIVAVHSLYQHKAQFVRLHSNCLSLAKLGQTIVDQLTLTPMSVNISHKIKSLVIESSSVINFLRKLLLQVSLTDHLFPEHMHTAQPLSIK